jgi:hypothetical protein
VASTIGEAVASTIGEMDVEWLERPFLVHRALNGHSVHSIRVRLKINGHVPRRHDDVKNQ